MVRYIQDTFEELMDDYIRFTMGEDHYGDIEDALDSQMKSEAYRIAQTKKKEYDNETHE